MSGTLVSFEIGLLVGFVLFLICERKGLIQKLPGLKNKTSLASMNTGMRTDNNKIKH